MAGNPRPVSTRALRPFAVPTIRARLGPEALVRRYTILVPMVEIIVGQAPRVIASDDDIEKLKDMLARHFGGVTMSALTPSLVGWGARDPRRPVRTREVNKHASFIVYAAAVRASDEYFLALKRELADALVEGLIRVERQDVTIL